MRTGFYPAYGKRVLDLLITLPALVLLAPVIAVVASLVKLRLGSPVLFRQIRPGQCERLFTMLKFRSMTDACDARGNLAPDSVRLTSLGKVLRKTSLDELPELWNVVRGDMSLVGPRPLLTRYTPYFTAAERVRFEARPGITGLAQVEGRNNLDWDDRIAADVRYVQALSFGLDLRIMCLTLERVLTRKGLQVDPGAVMLDFDEERRQRGIVPASSGSNTAHAC